MIDEAVRTLIDFIKTASPVVWEALVKQSVATAIANTIWGTALMVTTVILATLAKKAYRKYEADGDAWDMACGFAVAGAIIVGIASLVCLTSAAMRFYNPTYYAIELLIQSVQ